MSINYTQETQNISNTPIIGLLGNLAYNIRNPDVEVVKNLAKKGWREGLAGLFTRSTKK
jgi:hypothetical protein